MECNDIKIYTKYVLRYIHLSKSKFSSNIIVMNVLINMYAKYGIINKARELFNKMHDANIVSWNAMIGIL